jgi:hypothetical protein
VAAALLFGTLLSSLRHVDHVGPVPLMLLAALLVLSAWRPLFGLAVAAALVPVATHLAARYWNGNVLWPTPIVYAVLTGISVHALTPAGRRMRLPGPLTAPALCFSAVVMASIVVGLSPTWVRLGPSFGDALFSQLTRDHFVDSRSFPALQTGLLLLEGVVLFVAAARLSTARARACTVLAAAVAAGAAIAATMTGKRLYDAADRMADFWPSIVRLVTTLRWNVAYPDMNAAGSYFLMTAFVAGGLAIAAHRKGVRAAGIACFFLSAAALWLTGSRAAMLAGLLAAMLAAAIRMARGSRPRLLPLAALAVAALVGGLALAMLLPKKGNQVSSRLATDVRVGLVETSGRMIASRPFFGIGLAEFSRRSGEFSSPYLLAAFPPAVHENAHNNFLQIAAELGLLGGVLFVWLIAAGLWYAAPFAQDQPDRAARWIWLALVAFVLTWLGGHPLLVPEAALPFWILLGAAGGRGAFRADGRRWATPIALGCVLLLAVTLPSRLAAEREDERLEHVGIGVSGWRTDDDERYRTATGAATLFVPSGAFTLRVKPLTDRPVTLELQLGGRVANRVMLRPSVWNDVRMPARTQRPTARYPSLRLIVGDPADAVTFRMTKVVPLGDGPG